MKITYSSSYHTSRDEFFVTNQKTIGQSLGMGLLQDFIDYKNRLLIPWTQAKIVLTIEELNQFTSEGIKYHLDILARSGYAHLLTHHIQLKLRPMENCSRVEIEIIYDPTLPMYVVVQILDTIGAMIRSVETFHGVALLSNRSNTISRRTDRMMNRIASTFFGDDHVIHFVTDEPYLSPLHYIHTEVINSNMSSTFFLANTICQTGNPLVHPDWRAESSRNLEQISIYSKSVIEVSKIGASMYLMPIHDKAKLVRQDLFYLSSLASRYSIANKNTCFNNPT